MKITTNKSTQREELGDNAICKIIETIKLCIVTREFLFE